VRAVGMKSLAIRFPETVRTNDYFQEHYPQVVAAASQKTLAKMWSSNDGSTKSEPFDAEMAPYLDDPFRGAVSRRVLRPGEPALSMQLVAARDALAAARLEPKDVDLTIASTFYPDKLDTGNAAYIARDLGLGGTCFNLESGCSGSITAFQTACGLVRAGMYERILVVVATSYSHVLDPEDSVGWFLGDGAGAFVVGEVPATEGLLGAKSIHTGETCGIFYTELVADPKLGPVLRTRTHRTAGRVLRETSTSHVRTCAQGAAAAAGVKLGDIDFFVFQTSTAWFAAFAARALEVDPARTISTYPLYANVGSALMPANLFHAAHARRIERGSLVMVLSLGAASSANAAVVRWGDVGLGPPPAGSGLAGAAPLKVG
jgi:3-oxoacyl-[acyl-carrier-protein] synthase III